MAVMDQTSIRESYKLMFAEYALEHIHDDAVDALRYCDVEHESKQSKIKDEFTALFPYTAIMEIRGVKSCRYCGSTGSDSRGNCGSCGAPKGE